MMNSTPCHNTSNPARNRSIPSCITPLRNPPAKAPAKAGIPITITILMSTLPPRQCFIAPERELRLLTIILVPPAIAAGVPKSSSAGKRIVPKARPTNPPSIPTNKDMIVSKRAFQTRRSDGSPISPRVKAIKSEKVCSIYPRFP